MQFYRNSTFLAFASLKSIHDINFLIHSSWKRKCRKWVSMQIFACTHRHTPRTTESIQCLLATRCTRQQTALHFCGNTKQQSMSKMVLVPDTCSFCENKEVSVITVLVAICQTFPLCFGSGHTQWNLLYRVKVKQSNHSKTKMMKQIMFSVSTFLCETVHLLKIETWCLNKMIGKTCINYKNRKRWQQNWFTPV